MAWGLGIGAGVGLLKSELIDKPQTIIKNKLEAEKERYSPWTGQHGNNVAPPNPFEAALSAGVTGAGIARGLKTPIPGNGNVYSGSNPFGTLDSNSLQMPQLGDSYMSGWSK